MNEMKLIRKITIGKEYKLDAMHYTVGEPVSRHPKLQGYVLKEVIEDEDGNYHLYIAKKDEVIPWKTFNNMAVSVEYDIDAYEHGKSS